MSRTGPVAVPLSCAAVFQGAAVWLYFGLRDGFWGYAWLWFLIAMLQFFVFFAPVLALVYRLGLLNRLSIQLAGFVSGCLPYAIWLVSRSKPVGSPATWDAYVDVLFFGIFGVLSALTYVFTGWLLMRSNNRWRGP